MEAFQRNLEIVLEFASRVELFGNRDSVVAALRSLEMDEALAGCRRGLTLCYRDGAARGLVDHEIAQAPAYRRLLQLEEMIQDLQDSLPARDENSANQAAPLRPIWRSAEG